METTAKLNQNEENVLIACLKEIYSFTRVEFGLTCQVKVQGLTKNQIKGYLSALQTKGLINIWEQDDQDNQVILTSSGCDHLLTIIERGEWIQAINDIKENI